MVRVAVVGAGIVGLTSAVNIQKLIPHAKMTIIADKFDTDTTSSGAGGLYLPTERLIQSSGIEPETIRSWVQDSWDYHVSLAMSSQAKDTGHSLVTGYIVSDNEEFIENPFYKNIVFNFRLLTPDELKRLKFPFKYGCTFTTVITQTQKWMPWLMRQFREEGGNAETRTVGRIEELSGAYDIVVNCTGLGSKQLLQDTAMFPVKGQLVHVKAPWIKTFMYFDNKPGTYFIPHDHNIIVGGTREEGNYNLDVSPEIQQTILHRAEQVLPQITGADVLGSWVGLRPYRMPLRLEKQSLNVYGKKLRVVHNYGHGANGVTLSWGTALQAARLVKEWTDEIPVSARL